MNSDNRSAMDCGLPFSASDQILMSHGGGGRMMQKLLRDVIMPELKNEWLDQENDASVFEVTNGKLAFTTDSFVVKPLVFPGGDIGKLAIYGTVNDLAMAGARARYLTLSLILEEGLPIALLHQVMRSVGAAARECNVKIITGDTKVVERGKGDGIFINTAGIGAVQFDKPILPNLISPGDAIVLSGDLGRHGMAIMSAREGLSFESDLQSDCATLWPHVEVLLRQGIQPKVMRDLTRGGLASALNEIAKKSGNAMRINESSVPVSEAVRGACEILGLDPLYVANEGRMIAIVDNADAKRTIEVWRKISGGENAEIIGQVERGRAGEVSLDGGLGATRVLDMLAGEQMPRIC